MRVLWQNASHTIAERIMSSMWQPGNWITFEDWQGVIRTGKVRHAARGMLIVTHILTDASGHQVRVHETIEPRQVRDNWQAA